MAIYGRTIPLDQIESIQIYRKSFRCDKAGIAGVLQATGTDIALTGPIFLRDPYGKPCCHFKCDGTVVCEPEYTANAISWSTPEDFTVRKVPSGEQANWIECVDAIIDGKPVRPMRYGKDMGYSTNRVMVGTKDGRLAYYATTSNMTPEEVRDVCFNAGWDNAIMMDGGGSAFIGFKDGTGFTGDGRWLPFCLTIKIKHEADDPVPYRDTIHVYSKAADGNKNVSENFRVKEFACKDGSDPIFIADALVDVLQRIRHHFGKPMIPHSGYRTVQHNARTPNSSPRSKHCFGLAFDFHIDGVSNKEIAAYARELMPTYGGIGVYSWGVHVDVWRVKRNW